MDLLPDSLKFWQKNKINDDEEKNNVTSLSAPSNNDGATEVETHEDMGPMGGYMGRSFAMAPEANNTKDLINQYRTVAQYHEVDDAIQEIVDDAIVHEDGKETVTLDLDKTSNLSESVKNKIRDEFDTVLKIMDFNQNGSEIFKRWYVDSRIYFHKIVDESKKELIELRRLDPRSMEFVREIKKGRENGVEVVTGIKEYFVYTPTNMDPRYGGHITGTSSQKIIIPKDAIIYSHSGITDVDGRTILGHLHRAVKPANMLRMLEDALVIYRLARAPERRAFYIDVGNLQGKKASQYVNGVMQSMKNRVVYDSSTGKVKNQSNQLSMMEDFFLMRRDGKTATEIDTLPAGQNLGDMDDVLYFNKKLYSSLRIPLSRLPQEGGTMFGGNDGTITRDELKFTKFITRLQNQFKNIFYDALLTNLVLKKIITKRDWDKVKHEIDIIFNKDSYYEELQDIEILERRMGTMRSAEEVIGKYMSHETAQREILRMSEDQIKEEAEKIKEEKSDERFSGEDDDGFNL